MNRRDFFKFLGGVAVVVAVNPIKLLDACPTPEPKVVDPIVEIGEPLKDIGFVERARYIELPLSTKPLMEGATAKKENFECDFLEGFYEQEIAMKRSGYWEILEGRKFPLGNSWEIV